MYVCLCCVLTFFLCFTYFFQILYTIGGKDNVELARQYFAQSLELNGRANNLRALYGIILVRAH